MPEQPAAKPRVIQSAYLVVICDKYNNRILGVEVWSDPPWEKSRPIYHNAFVAYECQGETYAEASSQILESLFRKYSMNRWLAEHITSRTATREEVERAKAAAAEYDKLVFGDDEPTGEDDQ
jgi:hypothetical protein